MVRINCQHFINQGRHQEYIVQHFLHFVMTLGQDHVVSLVQQLTTCIVFSMNSISSDIYKNYKETQ